MIDEKKVEAAGRLLARANDGERSVIERTIALEYAYKEIFKACGNSGEVSEVQETLGISDESFVPWSAAQAMELMAMMIGCAPDDSFIETKARAIASALFPEVAKGMVSHE